MVTIHPLDYAMSHKVLCPRLGRPSKDAYTLMGALVFLQMHDVTDEETVRQLAFNTEWHYALDLSGESDEGKYVCLQAAQGDLFRFPAEPLRSGRRLLRAQGARRR